MACGFVGHALHPVRSHDAAFPQGPAFRRIRFHMARQLDYKSVKFLSRIEFTDSLKNIGNGKGSISTDYCYSWYAGI